jgi:hypothetical protein
MSQNDYIGMILQSWPIIVDQYISGKVPYLNRSGMQVLPLSSESTATIAVLEQMLTTQMS